MAYKVLSWNDNSKLNKNLDEIAEKLKIVIEKTEENAILKLQAIERMNMIKAKNG